jgi:hypothetical protein
MRIVFSKRSPGQIEFGIIYGGIAVLFLLLARFFPLLTITPSCLFKDLTGFACPTCGSTRSVMHLAHGEVLAALALNPLIAMIFVAAALYCIYCIVTVVFGLPRLVIIPTEQERTLFRSMAVSLIVAQWAYLFYHL